MNLPSKPSIVIVSSSNTKPKSLVKLITKSEDIKETSIDKTSTAWKLNTKYYTAEIDVHGITKSYPRDSLFNDSVEALIIHMDSNKDTSLRDIESWRFLEEECNPEIKLLITNYCDGDTKITKAAATEWCLGRGFELIELYPNTETLSTDQTDEVIKEKFGVERIVEALEAHVWPNLDMKDDPMKNTESGEVNRDLNGLVMGVDNAMSQMDDFAELFSSLHTMKESLKALPSGDRKLRAEEMVKAFWRAIGGDEAEIDLSDT